jgi:hypothetical protein
MTKLLGAFATGVLLLPGCGGDGGNGGRENTVDACRDNLDNDGDGHTDCVDQDCWVFVLCAGADADGDAEADADTDAGADVDDDGAGDADDGTHGDTTGCTSTVPYCTPDGRTLVRCDPATGLVETVESCYPDRVCHMGACVVPVCPPGESECVDGDTQRRCAADGSAWETTDCAAGNRCYPDSGLCEPPCLLRVFVLVDRSGSMSEGTPPKWDQAGEALRALMAGPAAADIEFGFGSFPTDDNCAIDGVVAYPVPAATAAVIVSFFGTTTPSGNTPLGFVFEHLATDTAMNLLDPAYHNALLLVTDGIDTCYVDCVTRCGPDIGCMMTCVSEAETLVAGTLATSTRALRDQGIRTYVVGLADGVSSEQLTAIATNGGTMLDRWIPAPNLADLEAGLQAIIDELRECNPVVLE